MDESSSSPMLSERLALEPISSKLESYLNPQKDYQASQGGKLCQSINLFSNASVSMSTGSLFDKTFSSGI
jgi:hypothetical protein